MTEWDQVTELLSRLIDAPADQRAALLEASGQSPEVRDQAKRLLAAWEADPDFLDPEPEKLEMVGPWRLRREVGRGGAGQVYEAVHSDPTDGRRVAVKVIADNRLTVNQTEAFLQERMLLAKLEHPNIARLYDTGKTPRGAPYFAMEFVDGLPVDKWFEQHATPLRQRVEIFKRVVEALAYAHGRMVVHGDLKPSNLFVNVGGEPRLLDFGAGRSLHRSDAALWPSMTPGFASPEQLSGLPISVASDVYQMGLLFQRLLIPPADTELQAITAKCVQQDPADRYGSAEALRADLDAWLQGRPVSVIAPSWTYLTRKFLRRNPLGAMLAVSLVLGAAATGWQWWRAYQSGQQSLHRFEEARRVSRAVFQDIRKLPVAARKPIVENMVGLLDRTADPNEQDPEVLLELANAWRSLAMVTGLPNAANLGDGKGAVAMYEKAIALAKRALPGNERVALDRLSNYYCELARVHGSQSPKQAEILRLLDETIVALQRYGSSEPLATAMGERAYFLGQKNRRAGISAYREAIAEFEKAGLGASVDLTAHLKRYGALLLVEQQTQEGVVQYQRALALERTAEKAPFSMSYTLSDLAYASHKLKRYDEAIRYCSEALKIREVALQADPTDARIKPALANSLRLLGLIHLDAGMLEPAEVYTRRAITAWAELTTSEHPKPWESMASAKINLALILQRKGAQRHRTEIAELVSAAQAIADAHPSSELQQEVQQLKKSILLAAK